MHLKKSEVTQLPIVRYFALTSVAVPLKNLLASSTAAAAVVLGFIIVVNVITLSSRSLNQGIAAAVIPFRYAYKISEARAINSISGMQTDYKRRARSLKKGS